MEIEKYLSLITIFIHNNKLAALAILFAVAVFAYKKPKEAFKFSLFIIFMAVTMYFISLLGDTSFKGFQQKSEGVIETEQILKQQPQ